MDRQDYLESLGLGVASISLCADDPACLDVVSYGGLSAGDPSPRSERFRGDTEIAFPGRATLRSEAGDLLDIDIVPDGDFAFRLALRRGGELAAQGLGLLDPVRPATMPATMMVSWWTGTTEPYGVVKYTITDDATIEGYYISKMTPELPGGDVATGNTRDGFAGNYTLNSKEVSGRTWGPHDWRLAYRGDLIDLTWHEEGRLICRGLGIADPHDPRSIIATYIAL